MDSVELDLSRKEAGREYLVALERLGLRLEALFWVYDRIEDRFVLMLATKMFDFKGPMAVAEMLFKAYDASATPREIDPLIVRLHSPDHAIIRFFEGWRATTPDGKDVYGLTHERTALGQSDKPFVEISVTKGGLEFKTAWVYRFELSEKIKSVDLSRRWNRFARNVEKIAA